MKRLLSGINEETFNRIAAELRLRLGVDLPDHNGTIEAQGFRVQIQHDGAAETLTLELLKKPWYVPEPMIERKVDEWLAGAVKKK